MKCIRGFLALPASLLVTTFICSTNAEELQWPHHLPRNIEYLLEDEGHRRRDLEIARRIESEIPAGVKKMGEDPGEKFFLQYWDFGEHPEEPLSSGVDVQREALTNTSTSFPLLPPIARHTNHDRIRLAIFGRNIFGRDFMCPADTSSCSSIGQSDLCCPNGESCVNTSAGVGCCPSGAICGDTVGACDTSSGYTSCSNSNNGGCCVPGASCLGSGCVFYGTETVTTTLPAATATTGVSTIEPPSTSPSETNPTSPQVIVSGYTTTATVTVPGEGSTQTTTVVVATTIIISASSSSTTPESTSTTTVIPSAPVRPTTVQTSSGTSVSAADISSNTACPTGFYMCSAVYLGGCCRVGRDCDTVSCPSMDSTNIITSGVTIAVPTGAGSLATSGTCANGWYNCDASAGGGCCPSEYVCGASCTATVSGVSSQPKEAPSSATSNAIVWGFLLFSSSTVIGMLWL